MSDDCLLSVDNVTKSFDGIRAIDRLSFEVRAGDVTALIGPNGAGKTTAFNVVTGFTRADSGRVVFRSRPITALPPHDVARLGIARTFQTVRLYPQMTVLENVVAGLSSPTACSLASSLFDRNKVAAEERENRERAHRILEFVSMSHKSSAMGNELSHGQMRLTELARVLALDPDLILLDEPTAGLFPAMIRQLASIIDKLRSEGKTILFIEHDMDVVMDISDRIIVLNNGRWIADGTPGAIQQNEDVITAYLGKGYDRAIAG